MINAKGCQQLWHLSLASHLLHKSQDWVPVLGLRHEAMPGPRTVARAPRRLWLCNQGERGPHPSSQLATRQASSGVPSPRRRGPCSVTFGVNFLHHPYSIMSPVKNNVGRGLNIALVNGERLGNPPHGQHG